MTKTADSYFRRLGFEPTRRDSVPVELAASPEFARACPEEPSCFTRCESPIDCAYVFDCFDVSGNREYTCIPAIWVR